ncbi:transposase [Nonomuraea sp. NPDC002799]
MPGSHYSSGVFSLIRSYTSDRTVPLEGDWTVALVAREFDINASTLGSWVNRHRIVSAQDERQPPVSGPDRARIRELERENAELREKLISLKKRRRRRFRRGRCGCVRCRRWRRGRRRGAGRGGGPSARCRPSPLLAKAGQRGEGEQAASV